MERTHRQKCFQHKPEKCESCEETESLHIHHIDGDHTNDDLENLVPLCPSCHAKVHNDRGENDVLSRLISRLKRSEYEREIAVSPNDFPGVPDSATVVTKETYPGSKYYYFQWRDGNQIKSKYIGKPGDGIVERTPQPSLADFS